MQQFFTMVIKIYWIKPIILLDTSVIAGYDNVFPPKMEYCKLAFNYLRTMYYVIGIADWDLYKVIDDREIFKYYVANRWIIISPQGIKADILLIMKAIQADCIIVTLDKFREHMEIIPSESWLKSHRATFDIIDGEFIIYFPN